MAPNYRRRRKLIQPGLQLRISGIFVGLVTLLLLLQFALINATVHQVANELPHDGAVLLGESNPIAMRVIGISALVFVPLTLLVGVLSSFRIAGPIFRMKRFLESVKNGESPADFRLRKGDELHEFAQLVVDATRPLRTESSAPDDADEEEGGKKAA